MYFIYESYNGKDFVYFHLWQSSRGWENGESSSPDWNCLQLTVPGRTNDEWKKYWKEIDVDEAQVQIALGSFPSLPAHKIKGPIVRVWTVTAADMGET